MSLRRAAQRLIGYASWILFALPPATAQTPELVSQGGSSMANLYGRTLIFDPAGRWVAAAADDGKISIFDTEGRRLARTIQSPTQVNEMVVDPAGKAIFLVGNNQMSKVTGRVSESQSIIAAFDPVTGKQLWSTQISSMCTKLAYQPGSADLSIYCYTLTSKRMSVSTSVDLQLLSPETGAVLSHSSAEVSAMVPSVLSEHGGLAAAMGRSKGNAVDPMQLAKEIAKADKESRKRKKGEAPASVDPMQRVMTMMSSSIFDTASWKSVAEVKGMVQALSEQARTAVVAIGSELVLFHLDAPQNTVVLGHYAMFDPSVYHSAEVSRDGKHYLLAGANKLTTVNSSTGAIEKNLSADLPYSSSWFLSPNGEEAAASQASSVFIYSLADGSRRILGDASIVPITFSTFLGQMQTEESSRKVMERADDRKQQEQADEAGMKKGPRSVKKEYNKNLERLQKEDQAQQDEVEKAHAATQDSREKMTNYMGQFGAVTAFPPVAALLESGRLLAVRTGDGDWGVWDTTTGNPLPVRVGAANLADFEHAGSRTEEFLQMKGLSELEQKLGVPGDQLVSSRFNVPSPSGSVACASPNNQHWVEVVRDKRKVSRALLHHSDGRTVDLLAFGVDMSALNDRSFLGSMSDQTWALQEQALGVGNTFCSLSPGGDRLIVEGVNPDLKDSRKAKIHELNAGVMAGSMYGRLFSDSLTLYSTKDGKKLCHLEQPAKEVFDLSAGEVVFSADGRRLAAGGARIPVGKTVEQRKLHVWDGESCKEIGSSAIQSGSPFAFSEDGSLLYTRSDSSNNSETGGGVHVFEASTIKPLFDLPDAYLGPNLLVRVPGSDVLLAPALDGTLGIWSATNGARLGGLRALQQGEWLITTPAGLFDGSPRGWQLIAWRDGNGLQTESAEVFFNEFFRPGLLAELLAGKTPVPPRTLAQIDRKQPIVRISSDPSLGAARTVTLHVAVEEAAQDAGGGVRDLRIFRNGTLIRTWRGALPLVDGKTAITAELPIVTGDNRFTAYAFNKDNVKSQDAETLVQGTAAPRQKTVYILAIGVNNYANSEFNLRYAAPDATRLAEALTESQRKLDGGSQVVPVVLLDSEATKANILLALERLGKAIPLPKSAPRSLQNLQPLHPEDTLLLYFAGHGIASQEHFYLIPHDLGYMGPRKDISDALSSVLQHGISELELESIFEPLDAAHIEFIVDACDSGKVLDATEQRRGPLNNRGLAQLAYEKGIDVLTAAQSFQAALESSKLGHGYLTFALIEEGLSKADTTPVDGKVTVPEWFEYAGSRVPALQVEALENATHTGRQLIFESASQSAAQHSSRESGLQTPRFYYRRVAPGTEAVISATEAGQSNPRK